MSTKLHYIATAALAALVFLPACKTVDPESRGRAAVSSEDATANPEMEINEGKAAPSEFAWSKDELPACFSGRSGDETFVYDEQQTYRCNGVNLRCSPCKDCNTNRWGGRATVRTTTLGTGNSQCPTGGVRIETFFDVNASGTFDLPNREGPRAETFACNARTGATGTSVSIVTETLKASTAAGGCPYGGVRFISFLDTDGRPGKTSGDQILKDQTLCNIVGPTGKKGSNGKDGKDGAAGKVGRHAMIVRLPLNASDARLCPAGGFVYETWTTTVPTVKSYIAGRNGNADYAHSVVCHAAAGKDGKDGVNAPQMRWESLGAAAEECNGRPGRKLSFYSTAPGWRAPAPLIICDGAQGAQGIQGIRGDKGDTGAAGAKGQRGDAGREGRMLKLSVDSFAASSEERPDNRCGMGAGVATTVCMIDRLDGPCVAGTTRTTELCDGADMLVQMIQNNAFYQWLAVITCVDSNHSGTCDEGEETEIQSIQAQQGPQTYGMSIRVRPPVDDPGQIRCVNSPSETECLAAMPNIAARDSTPELEVTSQDALCSLDPRVDKLDECANIPGIGSVRRHHCHYAANVAYVRTERVLFPTVSESSFLATENLMLERDELFRCAAGSTPPSGIGAGSGPWTGVKQFGAADATTFTRAAAAAVDGTVYFTGITQGSLDLQPRLGTTDAWLTRFSTSGGRIWTRQFGVSGRITEAASLATSPSGDIFLAGYTRGNLDGQTLTGERDLFITKYNANGVKQWTRLESDTTQDTAATDLALDASGNILVSGWVMTGVNITETQPTSSMYDLLVTKFSPTGSRLWTRRLGAVDRLTIGQTIAVDTSSNVTVGGYTRGALPGQTLTGYQDGVLVRYDSAGAPLWATQFGTEYATIFIQSVTTDSAANIYAAGMIETSPTSGGNWTAFIHKYSPTGQRLWTKTFGGATASTYLESIAIDSTGAILATGYTTDSLQPPRTTTGSDMFVVKLTTAGAVTWLRQFGTTEQSYTQATALTPGPAGSMTIGGHTTGTFGQTLMGIQDAYATRLDSTGARQ